MKRSSGFWTILYVGIIGMMFLATAHAQKLENVINRSLFTDKKAYHEGDIVTILLMEFTEGSNGTETNTNSDNRAQASASTSGKLSDLIPTFGLDSQITQRSDNSGITTSRGKLSGKITAVITEVLDNGLLTIQGTRAVNINGEKQTTIITGLVRTEDISSGNTIYSYNIANAQISYKGKGPATEGGKPGILTRIWNWIF